MFSSVLTPPPHTPQPKGVRKVGGRWSLAVVQSLSGLAPRPPRWTCQGRVNTLALLPGGHGDLQEHSPYFPVGAQCLCSAPVLAQRRSGSCPCLTFNLPGLPLPANPPNPISLVMERTARSGRTARVATYRRCKYFQQTLHPLGNIA